MNRRRALTRLLVTLMAMIFTSCTQQREAGEPARNHDSSVATSRSTDPKAATGGPSAPRVIAYKPGLRIDFRVPQVEADAEVILRRGQLELFAYADAPVPKEHETILRLSVAPLHIYEALGLIGLRPGHPMRYFPETGKVHPPAGDPVDVRVRYASNGEIVEVSACAWMINLDTNQPMAETHWLFAGSRRLEDGRFFANHEGTVVTVVDFDSALLALPGSHSSSDDQLWLGANTEAIPPVGTKVTLILRPASPA